jgi:prepilin-type N-terminal cleavage/methylation domain-containing protein
MMISLTRKQSGFSLIEMAVVLVIIGLLVTGLLLPLSAQIDQRNYNETEREMSEIRDALVGFALSNAAANGNPYLPCPDTDGDGFENRVGSACVNPPVGGLPWATLGLGRIDRWGNAYIYRVTQAFADSNNGFNLGTPRDIEVRGAAAGPIIAANIPAIIVSKGKLGAGAGVDEVENSDGDVVFVDRTQTNAVGNAYDDAVVWLPTAILMNRMVAAGRLP